jgi:hypothetical protein
MYTDNQSKFVVVIDRRKPLPQILNALYHVALGLVAEASAGEIATMEFLRYRTEEGTFSGVISRFPNIILQTDRGGQLRQFYSNCKAQSIRCHGFSTTMLGNSAEAQQTSTANAKFETLEFVLVAAFAPAAQLDPMTRKFSCWRQSPEEMPPRQFAMRYDTADGALGREMAQEFAKAKNLGNEDVLP